HRSSSAQHQKSGTLRPLSSWAETKPGHTSRGGSVPAEACPAIVNDISPQGYQAPSFREVSPMGQKCVDACHAGRPQAGVLWIHPGRSPLPEIDDFAGFEANCSMSK